ncbi:hypothetical protein TNCV_4481761 [Trichonephila clavipes]|nr:hypothetical protein TNCV_4481761 [Trichonephila clavipes]
MNLIILDLGDESRADTPSLRPITLPQMKGFELDRFIIHQSTLHSGSLLALGLEPVKRRRRVRDPNL